MVRSFAGMVPTGPFHPPDPVIAVGPAVIVGVTNHGVDIFDKTGTLLDRANFAQFFTPVRTNEGMGDPRVVFDPWSQRFLVSIHGGELPCPSLNCPVYNFIAVSRSPNPVALDLRDWFFYKLDAWRENAVVVPSTIDYTRLGVSQDAVVIVGTKRNPNESAYMLVRILPKDALVDGADTVAFNDLVRFTEPGGRSFEHDLQPAIHMDPSDVFFLVSTLQSGEGCGMVVWAIEPPLTAPRLTSKMVSSPNPPARRCSRPPDARQPDGVPSLFISNMPMQPAAPVYRNGSLWAAVTVRMDFGSGPVSAARLVQIDVSQWPDSATVVQDVLLGEDGVWNFFPAVGVSRDGHVAIVFARSSAREYPSAYITGRLAHDPLNTLRPVTLLKAGIASQTRFEFGGHRWGDYFAVALDPTDDSAWTVGEYTVSDQFWGTWIGQLDWSVVDPLQVSR